MNYETLKSAIVAVIKENGNEEITGDILQQVLVAMVNALGAGYQFAGVATPATDPGTPDQRLFYIAAESGSVSYPNFGVTVQREICVLVYSTSWTKIPFVSFDEEPTEDSGNLVSSGAIFQALENLASYVEDAFMPKVPTAVENNIATFDGAGKVKDSGKSFAAFLPADGIAMASGLIDVISAGTDQEFLYRKSGGDGVAFYKGIKGKSIVWNQLADAANNTVNVGVEYNGITVDYDTNTGKYRVHGTATADYDKGIITLKNTTGHKYYLNAAGLPTGAGNVRCYIDGGGYVIYNGMINPSTRTSATNTFFVLVKEGEIVDLYFTINVHDITLLGLGDLTAAQFKALYPALNYGYNPGIMKNNDADGIESVGFNQWDEEWEVGSIDGNTGEAIAGSFLRSLDYIPVIAGKEYFFFGPQKNYLYGYDANKNYIKLVAATGYKEIAANGAAYTIPEGIAFLRFVMAGAYGTVYNHDLCINISDPDRNGQYMPFWKKDIQLKLSALRVIKDGVEKVINGLDGVGSAFDLAKAGMDGYVRVLDKAMDEVDLGDLEWSKDTGINGAVFFKSQDININNVNLPNLVCPLFQSVTGIQIYNNSAADKSIANSFNVTGSGKAILVKDSAYSDADTFKAAMQGVKLRFELATPIHYELVEPFFAGIMVDEDGTEKAIAPSAATTPSAPFVAQTTYTISIPNLVKKIATI